MDFAVLDIETSNLNADFGYIMCAVGKELSTGKKTIFRIDDYKAWQKQKYNDKPLVRDLANYLRRFDGWVTYNGKRFDIPFVNARLAYHNLPLLESKFHIDLFYTVKYQLKLHNSRLETLINHLNDSDTTLVKLATKTHINTRYYSMATTGDKRGLVFLVDHCKRDVESLAEAYRHLKPLINKIYRS